MIVQTLKELMQRVETWPEQAQEELAELAREIEADLARGAYHATPDELAAIDRGLESAREGRVTTDEEIDAVFAKHRRE